MNSPRLRGEQLEQIPRRFCEAIEVHQSAILQRVNDTAGQRWMPAIRTTRNS